MQTSEYNKLVNDQMSEYEIQCQLTIYLRAYYPDVLWTASAGGMRTSLGTAVKMKKMGYLKGCPDILIFEPRQSYNGLAIELKTVKGKTTKEQEEWMDKLNKRGYKAMCCKGFEEAKNVIEIYFNPVLNAIKK